MIIKILNGHKIVCSHLKSPDFIHKSGNFEMQWSKARTTKGGFFSESAMCFSNLQKNIFQKTILELKFKFPANNNFLLMAGNLNFKLRIVFWNIFFEDLKKQIAPSKKSHLYSVRYAMVA